MSIINIYPLSPDYRLDVGAPWEAPATIIPSVNKIWEREKARRGSRLTNGRMYSLADFCLDYLQIRPTEYRYVLACRRNPNLKNEGLTVRPLAVTGILICADGVVLGRRGSSVANDEGLWEPAPAGGLSKPDPKAQLFEELEEELGFSKNEIASVGACGLVEDVETSLFDIVFRLETAATDQEVRAIYANRGSDEYSDLAIVKLSDVSIFLSAHNNLLLPALRPMLRVASIL